MMDACGSTQDDGGMPPQEPTQGIHPDEALSFFRNSGASFRGYVRPGCRGERAIVPKCVRDRDLPCKRGAVVLG